MDVLVAPSSVRFSAKLYSVPKAIQTFFFLSEANKIILKYLTAQFADTKTEIKQKIKQNARTHT